MNEWWEKMKNETLEEKYTYKWQAGKLEAW